MAADLGFSYHARKSGEVAISHHGAVVTILRAGSAKKFLKRVATEDPQQLMARVTGNYKRGNRSG